MTRFTPFPLDPKPSGYDVPILQTLGGARKFEVEGELYVRSAYAGAGGARRMAKLKSMARAIGADALIQLEVGLPARMLPPKPSSGVTNAAACP
jgi:hypothetical protein